MLWRCRSLPHLMLRLTIRTTGYSACDTIAGAMKTHLAQICTPVGWNSHLHKRPRTKIIRSDSWFVPPLQDLPVPLHIDWCRVGNISVRLIHPRVRRASRSCARRRRPPNEPHQRMPARPLGANQLRLSLASFTHVLICALRRLGLAQTPLARATEPSSWNS
jgi:hypothetical protein